MSKHAHPFTRWTLKLLTRNRSVTSWNANYQVRTRCLQRICLRIWFYPILCLSFPFPTRWWAKTDRYKGTASTTIICARKELRIVNHSYRDCNSHETLKGQVHYLNLGIFVCVQWKWWQVKPTQLFNHKSPQQEHNPRIINH